jgi:ligand-binding sensor domain-containing protein/serine phosphatase RsbU (regulator of sigma subunit)
MRKLTLLLALFCLPFVSIGQTYRFTRYTTLEGIPQDFIYTINQDEKGYLWIGTGEGLSKFDGKDFVNFSTNDNLSENVITCSFVDEDKTMWFGHNEGGITKIENNQITPYENPNIESKINGINSDGNSIYFVSQNEGLYEIKNGKVISLGTFGGENFYSLAFLNDKNLILGTAFGLLHIVKENDKWEFKSSYFDDEWISSISNSNEAGVCLIGKLSGGLSRIRLKDEEIQSSEWDSGVNLTETRIISVLQDSRSNIWLTTNGQGLIKLHADSTGTTSDEFTLYNSKTGLSSDYIQSVFEDREGNIWIGTFGAGLSTLIDDHFTFFHGATTQFNNNVSSIWSEEDTKWFGTEEGLIKITHQDSNVMKLYNAKNGLVNDKITTLFKIDSIMWIGTANNGAFMLDVSRDKMVKLNWEYGSLQNKVNQITGNKESIWIATEGGLIVYNTKYRTTNLFDTEAGLAHNAIKSVHQTKNGKIWMGTHSRFIYALHSSSIDDYEITSGGELIVVSITNDQKGNLWIATSENGVFKFSNNNFVNYSVQDGLKSNYTYAIKTDVNGYVWVGHRGGLSKISTGNDEIITYDHEEGISGQVNPNAMFVDEKNYLWIGTDEGIIKYDHTKDKRMDVPPVINLVGIRIGEKNYLPNANIDIDYGQYRIEFDFIGVSFKNPEKVTYQYQLEGYDQVYSNLTHEAFATYGRISDGEYTFNVIACNEDGICSDPAKFTFTIAAPYWKKWWFYALLIFFIGSGIVIAVQFRVKRLKDIQAYLKVQLDIKTKEVVDKANLIEEINNDLTSSINYAERIQSSILPITTDLTDQFPNSFIFFKPRDIVSGDFYFIRKYDERLIVACVDCTGHGVPGAFMSMIGSVTLRNIYKLMERTGEWMTPESVLELLDIEIQKILHQKSIDELNPEEAFFRSRDGMDMSICEINLKTNEVLISSAKRHFFTLMDGELELHSGDVRPIGGGDLEEIDFTLKTFQMKKGDALYLFSDGYHDQFGGPRGRKLKISGTKKIIEEMQELPTDKHSEIIDKEFSDWQGELDQIDDVLFIGIKL